ncbi:AAA family ATPase [Mangrovihabitans endophyticus]|uniref:Orc1-like AAA ATPase domain-containing protein n=1 Tax=Mangrovihabitans endophyticus TaxID=1751298 RepID=A0A8J3BYD1_9ACTN|nr:AAA family ATPase [Mangrovihabitans endophyticus]GGK81820.1 hypothetical protein GCM10012284_14850 [Mangrovihabitans endophyticus]
MTEIAHDTGVLPGRPRTLADRVRRSRRDGFVGRAEERRTFRRALRAEPDAPQVFFVHGVPGIGKSALLEQFADDALAREWTVIRVDGERTAADVREFEERAQPIRYANRPLLVVDRFEHCQAVETWLREEFLPASPESTVVVIAGQRPPQPQWTVDPGWRALVHIMELGPLRPDDVTTLLSERGIPDEHRPAIGEFAGGHPLALALSAEAATAGGPGRDDRVPSPLIVQTLLEHLLGGVPSGVHEHALRVCGLVRHVTVDLLRTGPDPATAGTVFDWLGHLPGVTPGRNGLHPHELLSRVVRADARWRNPEAYGRLWTDLWHALGRQARSASGDDVGAVVSELSYLLGPGHPGHPGPPDQESPGSARDDTVTERAYAPGLHDALLRLTRDDQGGGAARWVAHWLARQPEAFRVYSRADDPAPVACFGWLRLRPGTDDLDTDPMLAPVRDHLGRLAPLHDDDHIGVGRFMVPAPGASLAEADRLFQGLAVEHLRRPGSLAASFLLLPDPQSRVATMAKFGFALLPGSPVAGGRTWGVFGHDWRKAPMITYLDRIAPALGPARERPGTIRRPLSKKDHREAVRQVLRDWHDDDAVAANPLVRFYGDGAALRDALQAAVGALGADPSHIRHHRALRATYLERATSQEAAAARLDLPFSTYRRHLKAGIDRLDEVLRKRRAEPAGPFPQPRA